MPDWVLFVNLITIIFTAVTYVNMLKLTKTGYYLNIVFLFYGLIINSLNFAIRMLTAMDILGSIMSGLLVYGLA